MAQIPELWHVPRNKLLYTQRLNSERPTNGTKLFRHLELLNNLMDLFLQRRNISVSTVRSFVSPKGGGWSTFKAKLLYITWNARILFRRKPLAAGVKTIEFHVEELKENVRKETKFVISIGKIQLMLTTKCYMKLSTISNI